MERKKGKQLTDVQHLSPLPFARNEHANVCALLCHRGDMYRYTGFCDSGFEWQKMENSHLRESLGMKQGESGILIRRVEATHDAFRVLQKVRCMSLAPYIEDLSVAFSLALPAALHVTMLFFPFSTSPMLFRLCPYFTLLLSSSTIEIIRRISFFHFSADSQQTSWHVSMHLHSFLFSSSFQPLSFFKHDFPPCFVSVFHIELSPFQKFILRDNLLQGSLRCSPIFWRHWRWYLWSNAPSFSRKCFL